MVTAKSPGQLNKTGVVASFVTLARHDSKSGGTQQRLILLLIYPGVGTDLVDSRELSGMGT